MKTNNDDLEKKSAVNEPAAAYSLPAALENNAVKVKKEKTKVIKPTISPAEHEALIDLLKQSKVNLENLEITRKAIENLEFKLLIEPLINQVEADIAALSGHYSNLVREVADRKVAISLDVKDRPTSSLFYAISKRYFKSFYDLDWHLDFSINITYEEA
jgi:hypothetical protein